MRHLLFACGAGALLLAATSTAKAGDYGLSYGAYPSFYRAYTTDKRSEEHTSELQSH